MPEFIELYGQLGAAGVICVVFLYLIVNLITSQKDQTEDIDDIRQHLAKCDTKIDNMHSILLKMLDRWNKVDDNSQRHREAMVKELNDLSDVMMEVKGSVSRINGKYRRGSPLSFFPISVCFIHFRCGIVKNDFIIHYLKIEIV